MKHNLGFLATQLLSVSYSTLSHVTQNGSVSIVTSTLRNLHNNRRLCLNSSLNDSLHLLHGVEVESRDCVATSYSLLEHLASIYETQILVIYHNFVLINMLIGILTACKVSNIFCKLVTKVDLLDAFLRIFLIFRKFCVTRLLKMQSMCYKSSSF